MKMSSYILLVVVAALTMSLCDAITGDILRSLKSDIASLSRAAVHSRRPRNDVKQLTPNQKSEIVDAHNALRAREGSSNMELVSYDEEMEKEAEEDVMNCAKFEDTYEEMGQNRFDNGASKSINLTSAIQSWYDEKSNYDYDRVRCSEVKPCARYLQLVWAAPIRVGCAYKDDCPDGERILVCNYLPKPKENEKPYVKGRACSRCENRAWWCPKQLCHSECKTVSESCPWKTCAAVCHSCATIDNKTCHCDCVGGGWGIDCSKPCVDNSKYCGPGKQFPDLKSCLSHGILGLEKCPAMCGICTPIKDFNCPPVYGPASDPHKQDDAPSSPAISRFIKVQLLTTCMSAMVIVGYPHWPRLNAVTL